MSVHVRIICACAKMQHVHDVRIICACARMACSGTQKYMLLSSVTCIPYFVHVFCILACIPYYTQILQTHKDQGLFRKGLTFYETAKFWLNGVLSHF